MYQYQITPEQPQQNQPQQVHQPAAGLNAVSPKHWGDQVDAQTRMVHAHATQAEAQLILNGLREIREAISSVKVSDGDTGTNQRPPIESGFSDDNHTKLQTAYLNMFMRYSKYVDRMMEMYEVPLPNKEL